MLNAEHAIHHSVPLFVVKVYPNGSHNRMEVPPDNPNEYVRLKRFPPGFFETMVDWTTTQLRPRAPARR
jgi:hypothetical protein